MYNEWNNKDKICQEISFFRMYFSVCKIIFILYFGVIMSVVEELQCCSIEILKSKEEECHNYQLLNRNH